MVKYDSKGFVDEVWRKTKDEITIRLRGFPPFTINPLYKRKYKILKLVWKQQSTYKKKIIIFEEIELRKGKSELRLRYHIIGDEDKSMAGKWTFGQFATFLPKRDFREILALAKKNGML